MKRNLCSIYIGDDEANWFAPMHVVYLCLQFAGLVGSGQRSSYFVLYCSLRLAPSVENRRQLEVEDAEITISTPKALDKN